jgi:hypothetical protein
MDERDQSLAGVVVSLPPFEKERSDVRRVFSDSLILGALQVLTPLFRFPR